MHFRSFLNRMVRFFFCAFIIFAMASVGHAECNLPAKQKLTNKALLNAISKTEYAKWALYGPKDSEIVGKNVYATDFFKNTTVFPIVAVHDDQVVLLIMQRINNSWSLLSANERALVCQDFVLNGFHIGISGYTEDHPNVLVHFDFQPQDAPKYSDFRYSLYMFVNGKDGFIAFDVVDNAYHDLEQFRQFYSVIVSEDVLRYRCHDFTTLHETDYFAGPNPVDNSLAGFDMSTVPLAPSDIMIETQIHSADHQPVCLYQTTDSESIVLTEIPDLTAVLAIPEPISKNNADWYLVQYDDHLGYIQCSQVMHIE